MNLDHELVNFEGFNPPPFGVSKADSHVSPAREDTHPGVFWDLVGTCPVLPRLTPYGAGRRHNVSEAQRPLPADRRPTHTTLALFPS
jgi:hypothetical protein